jgi:hypothetical protein
MSGQPSDPNLGPMLFVATLFTGVLSLYYPPRLTSWPSWIGVHLPLAVLFLLRAYLSATFAPGDAIRVDIALLLPVVGLSLAFYVARLSRLSRAVQAWVSRRRGEKNASWYARTDGPPSVLARGLGLGLGAGFVSAWAWDVSMRTPRSGHGLDAFLVGLLLDLLPGMLYGLAVGVLLVRDLPDRKPARLAGTAMAGGLTFLIAFIVTGVSFGALSWVAPLLGGFTGSLLFDKAASRLLWPARSTWPLGWYVLSGTLASLALIPFCSEVVKGPETPMLHRSLYLGFMVWQGATATTLALAQPAPKASATLSEEV